MRQQRRSMVLDTRPFLVCMMQAPECSCFKESNSSGLFAEMRCQAKPSKGCAGDVETTGWTENHGGSAPWWPLRGFKRFLRAL